MLIAKAIQIRDAGTHIPAVAMKFSPSTQRDEAIVGRAGFHNWQDYVLLMKLDPMRAEYDPYEWGQGARTMFVAHLAVACNFTQQSCENLGLVYARMAECGFDQIVSGQVIDIEYLMGLRDEPKAFE